MRKLLKLDIRGWGKTIHDVLWFLGEHAFVATLLLVLGAGLFSAFLFWQYVIFSPQAGANGTTSEFVFQEELFEDILLQFKEEETRVREADSLNPRDLFNP